MIKMLTTAPNKVMVTSQVVEPITARKTNYPPREERIRLEKVNPAIKHISFLKAKQTILLDKLKLIEDELDQIRTYLDKKA